MNQINIPSITIDTTIPFTLNLRTEGQPLHGLHVGKHAWRRLTEVMVWENRVYMRDGIRGDVISYTVRTTGLAPQTKREKKFYVSERAALVKYVNEWIAKTVERGLKEKAEQKSEKEMRANNQRRWIAEQIEKAGGIEARRQEIVREGFDLAAQEAVRYESADVYGAIITALFYSTPIALDEKTRDRILAKYESSKTDWGVKRYIDDQTRELDDYLGKTQTGEAA